MIDNQDILDISEIYSYNYDDLPDSAYLIRYQDIYKANKTDDKLQEKLVSHKDYTVNTFRGDNQNHRLICQNNEIYLPMAIHKKNVYWCHQMLYHAE